MLGQNIPVRGKDQDSYFFEVKAETLSQTHLDFVEFSFNSPAISSRTDFNFSTF